ncbi:SacI homology domain-containing protein [Vararia minispora EC-137]|uniref:SacI homology domain-containing protein n=1 Tax=Vararia minispora EC-137 TaxID=1314806 RepID=A0ACB8QBT5_9AGAM|nr:SacI homology domain-containing protein [Vararia minispora EC-137]
MKSPHQRLTLYTQDEEAYIFVPAEPVGARHLVVHRHSGEVTLAEPDLQVPVTANRHPKAIYGILGVISLTLAEYIVLITGRELKGKILGHPIYRATEYEILPIEPNASVVHPVHPVEAHLLALIKSNLNDSVLIFSYEFDITRRLQAQWVARERDEGRASWEVVDDRFFWNKHLQNRFMDISMTNPQNDVTFDIRATSINGRNIQLCLISRRSRFRAGTRYFRRGIDHEGHVANFNETEQIVFISSQGVAEDVSTTLSFVQIRGSVPIFWAEINTLRYKPDLQIMDIPGSIEAARRHLQEQVVLYGDTSLVNLVDQKGRERHDEKGKFPQVQYHYFDFHTECKRMRWDRISLLVEDLASDLARDGYFHIETDHLEPVKWQLGVVRTNCMDNLDRTNVAQAAIAKWTLNLQLKAAGVYSGTDDVDKYEDLTRHFRELWSDHANYISSAYAGTPALKTDFVRTGKRTKEGALDDGKKSVMRYIKNNLFDGARQDAYDLITGSWIPRRGPQTSLFLITDNRPLVIRAIPYVLFFSLFMIFAGMTLPRTSDYSLLYYFALWFIIFAASLTFIFTYGVDYVSWPRLLPPTDVIQYNGPGYRSARNGMGFGIDVGALKEGASAQWMARRPIVRRTDKQVEEMELGTKRHID